MSKYLFSMKILKFMYTYDIIPLFFLYVISDMCIWVGVCGVYVNSSIVGSGKNKSSMRLTADSL
jgi:hypothetical protein